jgi:cysteinylglycine-S-conjugate dipeptidase
MGARLSQKSIPIVADFGKAFPEATAWSPRWVIPTSGPMGSNESLHLGDCAASCLAEILMLDAFAQLNPEG